MRRPEVAALALALAACDVGRTPFVCSLDSECDPDGTCEPEGYCSFPDARCEGTGRRFGELAGDALGGACVQSCVVAIYAGGDNTCAKHTDGGVSCWGDDSHGQLGDSVEDPAPRPLPQRLPSFGGDPVRQVAIGLEHMCAVVDESGDRRIECWGRNRWGQVDPSGSADAVLGPTTVRSGVSHVAVGRGHSCALLDDHTVECWGDNRLGQLGADSTLDASPPIAVVTGAGVLGGIEAIASGLDHACAFTGMAGTWCWGNNARGQIGDGTNERRRAATLVPLQAEYVSQVSGGAAHTCAAVGAHVHCWGDNSLAQVGTAFTGDAVPSPLEIPSLNGPLDLTAGADHTCAAMYTDETYCWGANARGQIGRDVASTWLPPMLVDGVTGAVDVAAGALHSCALLGDGRVLCWGANDRGQLGDGTTESSAAPRRARIVCHERLAPRRRRQRPRPWRCSSRYR